MKEFLEILGFVITGGLVLLIAYFWWCMWMFKDFDENNW